MRKLSKHADEIKHHKVKLYSLLHINHESLSKNEIDLFYILSKDKDIQNIIKGKE